MLLEVQIGGGGVKQFSGGGVAPLTPFPSSRKNGNTVIYTSETQQIWRGEVGREASTKNGVYLRIMGRNLGDILHCLNCHGCVLLTPEIRTPH